MPERLQRIKIADNVDTFAPTYDELAFQIEVKHEEDEKVDKLHVIVSDRLGETTWRGVWTAPGMEDDSKAKKIKSEGPPIDIVWKGEGLEEGVIASPLRSPFRITAFAEVSKLEDEEPSLSTSSPSKVSCPFAEEPPVEPIPIWALKSFVLSASGVSSKSYSLRDYIAGEFRIGEKAEDRFSFASGAERDVSMQWAFSTDTSGVESGVLELISIPKKKSLWKKELNKDEVLSKRFNITPDSDEDTALKKALTVVDSPYRLSLTVNGDNSEEWMGCAWTYIDVLVADIELQWGGAKLIPALEESPPHLRKQVRKAEALLLRELKKGGDPSKNQDVLTELEAIAEDPAGGEIEDGEHEVVLRSNIFYRNTGEWTTDKMATLYREMWGDGPRIPLVAVVKVRNAKGEAVTALPAIKCAQILWDWDDPRLAKSKDAPNADWLAWAVEEKTSSAATVDAPESTNCPVAYGGKRGSGGVAVFPPQRGAGDGAIGDDIFPWKVEAFDERKWAVMSTVYTGETEAYQGQAGVIFQPSRIAGDTYRVRAYLYTGDADEFDSTVSGPDLWEDARAAGLPCASAGSFEVWRRIDVLAYEPLTGGQPPLDFDAVNAKYAPARLRLYPPKEIDKQRSEALWRAMVAKLFDVIGDARKGAWTRALTEPLHPETGALLTLKTYTDAIDPWYTATLAELRKKKSVPESRLKSAENARPIWSNVAKFLTREELGLLATTASGNAIKDAHALPNGNIKPCATAMEEAYSTMVLWTLSDPKSFITFGVERHIIDPDKLDSIASAATLNTREGLHILHATCPSTTRIDTKGSAFAIAGDKIRLTNNDRHHCGFYATKPDVADLVRVEAPSNDRRGVIPGRAPIKPSTAGSDFTLFLSTSLLNDSTWGPEIGRVLAMYCNAVVGKVLSLYKNNAEFKKRDITKADLGRERDVDLWHDWVSLIVRGQSDGVKAAKKMLEAALILGRNDKFVELRTRSTGNERDIYVSLVKQFDAALSSKVRFPSGRTTLRNTERTTLREWAANTFSFARTPITQVYVYHRDSANGKARANNIADFLRNLFKIARLRVKINPLCDLRSIHHRKSERNIYLSFVATFDEKQSTRLRFVAWSASIHKNGIAGAIREFVEMAWKDTPETQAPIIYVYYRDSKLGRHRKLKVVNHIDALFRSTNRATPDQLEPSLDLPSLVAHEMAHGLSLEHARPVDTSTDWRHVKGFNCLMNYDASETEFCGLCNLWLRGWNIGTLSAPKFPATAAGYPKHAVTIRTTPVLPQPTEDETLHAIGWHGTISSARESLEVGLRPVASSWDPESGGELGPGFYVATEYETACLYGAGMAELKGSRVDVWRVELTDPLDTLKGAAVPPDKQFKKYVVDEFKDNDYLWNRDDKPISQYKFNDRALPKLRITLEKQGMSPNFAFNEASRKHAPVVQSGSRSRPRIVRHRPARVVPTAGDGDCFFHAVAYHCVMPSQRRGDYDDGRRTFGLTTQEKTWTRHCRREIASDLTQAVYDQTKTQLTAQDTDPQLTVAGQRYERLWDALTGFGNDVDHWGDSLLDTVVRMDEAACGEPPAENPVWGDVQFLFQVILARYTDFARIVVHHGAVVPLVYGAAVGEAIHLHHHGAHYEVVLP